MTHQTMSDAVNNCKSHLEKKAHAAQNCTVVHVKLPRVADGVGSHNDAVPAPRQCGVQHMGIECLRGRYSVLQKRQDLAPVASHARCA